MNMVRHKILSFNTQNKQTIVHNLKKRLRNRKRDRKIKLTKQG